MQLRVDAGETTFRPREGTTVRIGRALDSEVLVAGDSVSRAHAELRPTAAGGWVLVDVGSQHGTYVDGHRITEHSITAPTRVDLGLRPTHATITITPEPADVEPAGPAAPATNLAGGGAAPLVIPPSDGEPVGPPPVVAPVAGGFAETVSVGSASGQGPFQAGSGPDLLVRVEGTDHRFQHPASVTIGRHPASTVVVADQVTSRYHGRIEASPGGWEYVNVSEQGSYVDGRRRDQVTLKGVTTLRLGHPVAGTEVEVTEVRDSRTAERQLTTRRRTKTAAVAAACVAVLLLIVGTAVVVSQDDDSPPAAGPAGGELSPEELDQAKLGTVLIVGQGLLPDGSQVQWSGSGSIISSDGLILTNAHVAEPQAAGLSDRYGPSEFPNPRFLAIALIREADDRPADLAYIARVVESDGYLDASVLQIVRTIDGEPIGEDLDLPAVSLGDSDELRTGEDVTILGFPSISQSQAVSVTRGVISTFLSDPQIDDPRAEIDTDARIAPGNSGGLAVNNDGELIGIPSALVPDQGGAPVVSGRVRPINLVMPLIEAAE